MFQFFDNLVLPVYGSDAPLSPAWNSSNQNVKFSDLFIVCEQFTLINVCDILFLDKIVHNFLSEYII